MKFRVLAAFSMIIIPSIASSQGNNIVWIEYPESGVVLGQGYNMLEHEPTYGTCVDFVPVQDPSQEISYKFEEVSSTTDIKNKLDISASGSMKMAILKATAHLNFLADEKFRLDTKKFFLRATVTNSALFTAPSVSFKKGATVLGKEEIEANFLAENRVGAIEIPGAGDQFNVSKCGHGFVAAIISGASLDSFLTWSKSDAESLAKITGGLEANIGGIFTVKGSLESRQEAHNIQENTSISVFKSGGAGGSIAYNLDSLKQSLSNLTQEATTVPKPIRIGVLPYSALNQAPPGHDANALIFQDAVAAYFLAKDVFDNTSAVIEEYFNFSNIAKPADANIKRREALVVFDIKDYVSLNQRAMNTANELSNFLSLCKDALTEEINELPESPEEGEEAAEGILNNLLTGSAPRYSAEVNPSDVDSVAQRRDVLIAKVQGLNPALLATADVLEECAVTEGSNFETLISSSISLTAENISKQPIYWNELANRFKQDIVDIKAQHIGGDTSKIVSESALVLKEFVEVFRSTQRLRDICSQSFAHPICSVNAESFVAQAMPEISQASLNTATIPN
ncbi:hypothetical protein J3R80_13640 [Aliiroseovarius sp. Z3]|uniref:hypothetical protein n=1 Tax=Aliiroseovarius sp. Z3 TaxID=2811402 RepID=UPI0023B21B51|nr:hypothetical protein [Aliiroseovarius sp. Z3]MDE9451511.1 hypothetical protein [Aliiroseovarius sp. Z3]